MSIEQSKQLPKVLSVNINVWRDDSAIRTLPEIFACWDRDRLAQIYTRAGVPDTKVCDRFLRINENAIIKSIFKRSVKTATKVYNSKEHNEAESAELQKEQQRYKYAAKRHSWFMTLCRDIVWVLGKWKTKELDAFLEETAPDVLFMPIYPVVYMSRIQRYIIKRTNKPVACYLADDNFSYAACGKNIFAYIHRFWLRKGTIKLIKSCDKLFVMVPKTAEECKKYFGKDCEYLTKAIDFTDLTAERISPKLPLKMIYTGKLVIGRDKALMKIAEAVAKINEKEDKILFDVYSSTEPSKEFLEVFSTGGCRFMGQVSKEQVDALQKQSDIVVFAESLSKKHCYSARLSFSTKITDYFKSGRCVFALGNKNIAPMDYLIKEDAAIAVTDYKDIESSLRRLCDNPQLVSEYGEKAFLCGKKNHDSQRVLGNFKKIMCDLAKD